MTDLEGDFDHLAATVYSPTSFCRLTGYTIDGRGLLESDPKLKEKMQLCEEYRRLSAFFFTSAEYAGLTECERLFEKKRKLERMEEIMMLLCE